MHWLISGGSGDGKTTLATRMSHEFRARQFHTLVYDPFKDERWNASFLTDDFNAFMEMWRTSRNCVCFVDEVATLSDFKSEFIQLPAMGRHYGHVHYYIGQRATMVPTNIRNLCKGVYAFPQVDVDAEMLARTFRNNGLRQAEFLKSGEFLFCDKDTICKGKVW